MFKKRVNSGSEEDNPLTLIEREQPEPLPTHETNSDNREIKQ